MISPEGILMRLTPRRTSRSTAGSEKGVEKNSMPMRAQCAATWAWPASSSSSALIMSNWLVAPVLVRW